MMINQKQQEKSELQGTPGIPLPFSLSLSFVLHARWRRRSHPTTDGKVEKCLPLFTQRELLAKSGERKYFHNRNSPFGRSLCVHAHARDGNAKEKN
jgi:hypothetical protein